MQCIGSGPIRKLIPLDKCVKFGGKFEKEPKSSKVVKQVIMFKTKIPEEAK